MISEEEARASILESIHPLPARRVAISGALDCFAAKDIAARLPLPNFDNSAMDGYAVIASATRKGSRLRIIGEQPAGKDRHLNVARGEAVRIFTGAPIPSGADAVVMQEDVSRVGDDIIVNDDVDLAQFIRRRGCDLSEGQKIIAKGERIRATTLALMASQGFAEIEVGGEVRSGIISTGDELTRAGEKLQAGQIYESNSVLLSALLNRWAAVVASHEHCADDANSLRGAFEAAASNHILIVSGGVSVGEHDLVQSTLRALGAKIDIWRVAIKPGKPFLFGRLKLASAVPSPQSSSPRGGRREALGEGRTASAQDCLIFGLPGNPVSAFVTFLRFVRPAILKMMGAHDLDLTKITAKLTVDLTNDSERAHYIRGKLENGTFAPIGRQESHALFGLSQSNALLCLAPDAKAEKGTTVNVELWD